MISNRIVRCVCCGCTGRHEARGLIKSCYERTRQRGLISVFHKRQPMIRPVKERKRTMVQTKLHRVFDAILADPQASMREIEQAAGVALSTV